MRPFPGASATGKRRVAALQRRHGRPALDNECRPVMKHQNRHGRSVTSFCAIEARTTCLLAGALKSCRAIARAIYHELRKMALRLRLAFRRRNDEALPRIFLAKVKRSKIINRASIIISRLCMYTRKSQYNSRRRPNLSAALAAFSARQY